MKKFLNPDLSGSIYTFNFRLLLLLPNDVGILKIYQRGVKDKIGKLC